MKIEFMGEEDERWHRLLVPLVSAEAGTILLDNGETINCAIVRLDVSARPDVADLARVIATERIDRMDQHPAPVYSMPPNAGLLEHFEFTDPVDCGFTVFVPWRENEIFFKAAEESGVLALTFKEGVSRTDEMLFFRISASELNQVMEMWKAGEL